MSSSLRRDAQLLSQELDKCMRGSGCLFLVPRMPPVLHLIGPGPQHHVGPDQGAVQLIPVSIPAQLFNEGHGGARSS